MNRTSLLRKISALALTFGIGIGAAFATAAPASAWTGASAGQTGGATLPTISVGDVLMPSGYWAFTLYGTRVRPHTGFRVRRAPRRSPRGTTCRGGTAAARRRA